MIKLTTQQADAINYTGHTPACVTASAGSGKTFVLVEHIAKLISDPDNPVPADRLAAVTFTEKAAAELKQRLSRKVKELMEQNPEQDFLREQLVRLSSARISTISSFCLSLIRDNIRLLPDIDEGFKICDSTKESILSEKAEQKVFEYIYTDYSEEEKKMLFKKLGKKESIMFSVKKFYSFLSNIPDPDEWKNEQELVFGEPRKYFQKYVRCFIDDIPAKLITLAELCENAVSLLPRDKSASTDSFKSFFEFIIAQVKTAQNAYNKGDYKTAYTALEEKYPSAAPIARTNALKELGFKEKKEEILSLYQSCGDKLSAAANYESDALEIKTAFSILCETTELYQKEYEKLKKAEGVLDFSDLEKNALKVVRKGGGKGLFDYIIVDEFQDSNDIQYEIFKTLSGGDQNLYFVGDVKQCIYAFRSANPRIFGGLIKNPAYKSLELNSNIRSGENVIDSVNAVFASAKLPTSFDDGGGWKNMNAARGISAEEKNVTEFVVINALNDKKNERSLNREKKYVASRILEMVNSGFTVHERDKGERKCGFGDFAVLLRTNGDCVGFRKVFEEYGIPCVSEGEKHFTDLTEIELALSLISAVLRPNNDVETTKACSSDLCWLLRTRVALVAGLNPTSHDTS